MADADKPWGRRLIICCDGTWQSSVANKENVPSNVTKLCRVIKNFGADKQNSAKKWHQIVYYDGGIGTGDISGVESARQGGTGAGLAENVIEAYNFIVLNYEEGDEIFCFGFSRGAYTARAVAGLVTDIGVLKPLQMQFFPVVYRAYMANTKGKSFRDFAKEEMNINDGEFKIKINNNTRQVKVIGVWDTVGSLGVPDVAGVSNASGRAKYGFHNVTLSRYVKHAYHALALDERRQAFRPTLWYIPEDLKGDDRPELKQVWFPGVHINCGGGSDDGFLEMEGDMENISVATFTWMLQCIAPHLDIDESAFTEYLQQYKSWLTKIRERCTYHHKMHETWFRQKYNKLPNIPYFGEEPDPLVPPKREPEHRHDNFDFGWGIGPVVDSFTTLFRANGRRPRQPGHEEMEIEGKWTPIAGTARNPTGNETNEYIHPLVWYRQTIREWTVWKEYPDPHPLTTWDRWYEVGADGRQRYWWQNMVNGKHVGKKLPEWAILPHTETEKNYERRWYETAQRMGAKLSTEQVKRDKANAEGDYLQSLDRKVDFKLGAKAQNEWP